MLDTEHRIQIAAALIDAVVELFAAPNAAGIRDCGLMGRWWRDGVVYGIYPRWFADSDGDGVGDPAGITNHLGYVAELGVQAVWITPFQSSPQVDHGYDVSDYCDVDPLFGDLAAFDEMLRTVTDCG
jgi:alpha-glucosidase